MRIEPVTHKEFLLNPTGMLLAPLVSDMPVSLVFKLHPFLNSFPRERSGAVTDAMMKSSFSLIPPRSTRAVKHSDTARGEP